MLHFYSILLLPKAHTVFSSSPGRRCLQIVDEGISVGGENIKNRGSILPNLSLSNPTF
jgi:hypothetical protein